MISARCATRRLLLLALLLAMFATRAQAQVCANPGRDGPGGTLSGVVNTYYPGTASAAAGSTSISIGTATGSVTPIASGDLLLVIQMQDAAINSNNSSSYGDGVTGSPASGVTSLNNSGRYEYVVATSAAGATVSIRGAGGGNGLVYSYTNAAASGTQGQRRFQVVRVPQYSSATLSSGLTAAAWNGSTGGILALDVAGNLTLGGTVSVTGLGFRGGGTRQLSGQSGGSDTDYRNVATANYHSGKAEGIAGTPRYVYDAATNSVVNTGVEGYPNGSTARGAPGNAGGGGTDGNPDANDENSGGGGGGNGGAGGFGGNTWNSNLGRGGHGGAAVTGAADRVVMGGGGGGGSRNNSSGTMSSGGAGGGIVMIRADTMSGSGTITANGSDGLDAQNDGGGGGGSGGSVIVIVNTGGFGSLTVNARGGNGGDAWITEPPNGTPGARHGPGGGGGGGFIAVNAGATTNVTGGTNGVTTTVLDAYGATAGGTGAVLSIAATSVPGARAGAVCVPNLTVTKTTSTATVNNGPTGTSGTYTIVVANAANLSTANNLSISDALPGGFAYASTTSVTLAGGATRPTTTNPTAGATTPAWSSFTIPASASVTLTFTVTIPAGAGGTYQNPATATYTDPKRTVSNGTTTASYNSASSTGEDINVIASPNVGLVKSVSPSGPQLPGTDLVYTITYTNTGGRAAQSFIIIDPNPANIDPLERVFRNVDFKIGSMTSAPGSTGLVAAFTYSNDGGVTWTYTPVSGGGGAPAGYDRNVTNVRWVFAGNLSQTAPNNTGSVGFTARIR